MYRKLVFGFVMILNLRAINTSVSEPTMSEQAKNTMLQLGSQLKEGAGTIGGGFLAGVLSLGSLPIATAVGKVCIDIPLSITQGITSAAKTFKANMDDRSLGGQIVNLPFEVPKFLVNATGQTIKEYAIRSKHLVTNFPLYFSSYWSYRMLQDQQAGRRVDFDKALLLGGGLLLRPLLRSVSKSKNTEEVSKICKKCSRNIANEKDRKKENGLSLNIYCECESRINEKLKVPGGGSVTVREENLQVL